MVSVCLLSYNGERFILEQIESILKQLSQNDEIIVSDDGSTDKTIEIIRSFEDNRIKIFHNESKRCDINGVLGKCFNVGRNAENAIKRAKGDYIFLADQDDVWMPGKISKCIDELQENDLVITNHITVDEKLNALVEEQELIKQPNLINTLLHTQFLGCCMAFKSRLLEYIIPFPKEPLMHDIWIGLMALKHGKIGLVQEPYLLYRRHSNNASINIEQKSTNPLSFKLMYRYYLLKAYLRN